MLCLHSTLDSPALEELETTDVLRESINTIRRFNNELDDVNEELLKAMQLLWENPKFTDVVAQSYLHCLPDSTQYFLERKNFDRIMSTNYVPVPDDIVRLRVATTGINEFYFEVHSVPFRLVDVGGQRSERRKWIHCFENVSSILFLVAISEYDQTLAEDPTQNRLLESLALFKAIALHRAFEKIPLILFFNKTDIFEKKILKAPLSQVFPEYEGTENVEAAKVFIRKKFVMCNPYPEKVIYSHFTCATDTENIKVVFEAVKDSILRKNLSQFNLI